MFLNGRKPIIMIAAGGTGGHVFPGLAVARRLQERNINVVWLGSTSGFEFDYVTRVGVEFEKVDIEGLRRRGLLPWLFAPWRLSWALIQVFRIFLRRKPNALIGFGGFVAGPGGAMAVMLGIPLLIHEQNAVAGLTNKLLAPFARRVLLGFPQSITRRNAQWVGNPVRADITALPVPEKRLKNREGAFRLLVIGGSRGAMIFNEIVPKAIAKLDAKYRLKVRQQTGYGKIEFARKNARNSNVDIEFLEFIDNIAEMYAWADLVLCRAGALSVAEVAAAGVAAVFVPYPHAVDDHQTANARFLSSRNAAMLLFQSEFTPQMLVKVLKNLIDSRQKLIRLAMNARKLAQSHADVVVADLCEQAMRK